MIGVALALPASAQTAPPTTGKPAANPAAKASTAKPASAPAKTPSKAAEAKKTDAKKTDAKKTDVKKTDVKKTEAKPAPKKPDARKAEAKKPEPKKAAPKAAAKPAHKPAAPKATAKSPPAAPYVPPPVVNRAPPVPLRPGVPRVLAEPPGPPSSAGAAPAMNAPPVVAAPSPTVAPQKREPLVEAPGRPPNDSDIAAVRRVIETMRGGNRAEALRLADAISEPVSRKLAEWIVLRFDDNFIGFSRYAAFIDANPTWPSVGLFRRRAEATMWQERVDAGTIRAYFAQNEPLTAKGRFAFARALLAAGDRDGAQAQVREAWRNDPMTADLESQARDQFGALLDAGDDKARMENRLYANDSAAGLRAAHRLGAAQVAIARARSAVTAKAGNARALVNAVPREAHNDVGYLFAHLQLLRREEKFHEAARIMAGLPRDPARLSNTDEWWIERRLLARKLLDVNDPKTAYVVARDAAVPHRDVYRVEREFTAGWIALRFLHDHQTAIAHFSRINQVTTNPISLARAGYWTGRALEAAHRPQEARKQYEAAARWSTAYYGQIARAKLGLGEMVLHAPQASAAQRASVERLELVRAAEVLYTLDEPNLVRPLMADLGDRLDDIGALTALGEMTARHEDPRSMLLLGKAALARGYPFGQYAFPTAGVPNFSQIGPRVEPALVYSIIRQESGFDPGDMSPAKAVGLMQVTPVAAKDTCKRYKCTYDFKRLKNDVGYNLQIGAAELGGVLNEYRGSYILTFAAYNAGRGSVREWISRYGDPRDPGVDPIDWVERIPFSETRNYVQRVMENLQVYRVRFGGGSKLLIEADLRRGAATAN
jgi:soluble lytic murein transglycosylase